MRKFIAGIVIGLLLSAGSSRAEWGFGDWGTLKEIRAEVVMIRIELQRIANAQDRLVSIQSGATRAEVEKRNQ